VKVQDELFYASTREEKSRNGSDVGTKTAEVDWEHAIVCRRHDWACCLLSIAFGAFRTKKLLASSTQSAVVRGSFGQMKCRTPRLHKQTYGTCVIFTASVSLFSASTPIRTAEAALIYLHCVVRSRRIALQCHRSTLAGCTTPIEPCLQQPLPTTTCHSFTFHCLSGWLYLIVRCTFCVNSAALRFKMKVTADVGRYAGTYLGTYPTS
jgi:hypothetical protein